MRPAHTYRAALRNELRAKGQLSIWRKSGASAAAANARANLPARRALANAAREAAAKALASVEDRGLRLDTIAAVAMLGVYRAVPKRTRAVSRIIRQLESAVRS